MYAGVSGGLRIADPREDGYQAWSDRLQEQQEVAAEACDLAVDWRRAGCEHWSRVNLLPLAASQVAQSQPSAEQAVRIRMPDRPLGVEKFASLAYVKDPAQRNAVQPCDAGTASYDNPPP